MKTVTHYFDTRTLARNAVADLNGKFHDFGTDAPKGKRWSVQVEQAESTELSKEDIKMNLLKSMLKADAKNIVNLPGSIIAQETLTTPNNKPVNVLWRRSMQSVQATA